MADKPSTPISPLQAVLVAAGQDRHGERRRLGISEIAFKVIAPDGSFFLLENTFHAKGGPARHLHYEQDEWFYIAAGEFIFEVGGHQYTLHTGDSLLAPRRVPHVWACTGRAAGGSAANGVIGNILISFLPAGQMEAFFRAVTPADTMPKPDHTLWSAHGMELLGPPLL